MAKRGKTLLAAAILALVTITAGCSPKEAERDTLMQVSTIDALLGGLYDGVLTVGDLQGYGDFGIGTFHALDGEMLGFDGTFYQVKADGTAQPVDDSTKTPFAAVTFFDTDRQAALPPGLGYEGLAGFVKDLLPTGNIFYAVRIEGTFSDMKTRSVPPQEKPYPPLVSITANQPTFEFRDVPGVMVGFWCPDYVEGINVPGYHLHFITEDRTAGGHVLDFTVESATLSLDDTARFTMMLPGPESAFYRMDLSGDKQEELEAVEK